jgi:hypothetical protein
VTKPVAVKGETVAEKVTGCPVIDGFKLDAGIVIVVGTLFIVKFKMEPPLLL